MNKITTYTDGVKKDRMIRITPDKNNGKNIFSEMMTGRVYYFPKKQQKDINGE